MFYNIIHNVSRGVYGTYCALGSKNMITNETFGEWIMRVFFDNTPTMTDGTSYYHLEDFIKCEKSVNSKYYLPGLLERGVLDFKKLYEFYITHLPVQQYSINRNHYYYSQPVWYDKWGYDARFQSNPNKFEQGPFITDDFGTSVKI